jgi:hypothetical protein
MIPLMILPAGCAMSPTGFGKISRDTRIPYELPDREERLHARSGRFLSVGLIDYLIVVVATDQLF